jgi:hypothetical protein
MSFALVMLVVSSAAAPAPADAYSVVDPRPMAKALDVVEHMCRCIITYEDPPYDAPDADDRRAFTFRLVSRRDQRDLQPTLQALVEAFERSGNPGRFRVYAAADGYRVGPQDAAGSILQTRLATKAMRGTALAAVTAFTKSLGAAARTDVALGTMPSKLLERSTARLGPQTAPAEDILADILRATGHKLSWRLNYDATRRRYVLNIHTVD